MSVIHRSRLPALALVLGLHIGLLLVWRTLRPAPSAPLAETQAMQWVWIQPSRPPATPPPAPLKPAVRAVQPARLTPHPQVPAAVREPEAITVPPADPFAAPAPPSPDIVRKALGAVGKIDRDLRRESPSQIHAPVDTGTTRLEAGIRAAGKWDGPTTVEEIIAPNDGSGKRVSKIRTPFGTYCATVAGNHSGPDMFEPNKAGPKMTNCPR